MPPNPAHPPVAPKRYVQRGVEPVCTLLSCGNAAVSVLVSGMDLAWLSGHEGRWHSTGCYLLVVCFSQSAQSGLVHTAWEEPLLYDFILDQVQVLSGSHHPNCARQGID